MAFERLFALVPAYQGEFQPQFDVVADGTRPQYKQYRRYGQGEVVSYFVITPRADDAAEQKRPHQAAQQPHFGFVYMHMRQMRMVRA